MTTKRTNPHCRPGTTDAMQRLADENEALRAERDGLVEALEDLLQLTETERPDWDHKEQHQARAALKQ